MALLDEGEAMLQVGVGVGGVGGVCVGGGEECGGAEECGGTWGKAEGACGEWWCGEKQAENQGTGCKWRWRWHWRWRWALG